MSSSPDPSAEDDVPLYLLCGPSSPFAPREELTAYLAGLRTLDQRSTQVRGEIERVERALGDDEDLA